MVFNYLTTLTTNKQSELKIEERRRLNDNFFSY